MKCNNLDYAIEIATLAHKGQKRKSGEEYIIHPLFVMNILKKYDFSEKILICAVLHDVCEDTNTKNIEIKDIFGSRVGFIVNALSKNPKPKNNKELKKVFEKEKISQQKTFQEYIDYRFSIYVNRFYVSVIADPRIMFIKMADQIHNISTLNFVSARKRKRKIEEIENYFIPMYYTFKKILTPMYIEKYNALMKELMVVTKKTKKEFGIKTNFINYFENQVKSFS